eukprot:TRINITY_DN21835_c0_g2_i2.p1 TRINITY_DN21835_c0_g2~~TRINITY_DN21835_c0_g2_i2.p1  ORF type:complete len:416 (+),score=97.91 TRINITY_DN21835_c0_g2_i2:83-1330(+)
MASSCGIALPLPMRIPLPRAFELDEPYKQLPSPWDFEASCGLMLLDQKLMTRIVLERPGTLLRLIAASWRDEEDNKMQKRKQAEVNSPPPAPRLRPRAAPDELNAIEDFPLLPPLMLEFEGTCDMQMDDVSSSATLADAELNICGGSEDDLGRRRFSRSTSTRTPPSSPSLSLLELPPEGELSLSSESLEAREASVASTTSSFDTSESSVSVEDVDGPTPRGDTLRAHLKFVQTIDTRRVLVVRHITQLGFSSAAALAEHFCKYGQVSDVLVAHAFPKLRCRRRRPGSMALLVMGSADAAALVLGDGPAHLVPRHQASDPAEAVHTIVEPFSRPHSESIDHVGAPDVQASLPPQGTAERHPSQRCRQRPHRVAEQPQTATMRKVSKLPAPLPVGELKLSMWARQSGGLTSFLARV